MNILYAVSEADPFVKHGGLGEVAGAFPVAMTRLGVDFRVILPMYDSIPEEYRSAMELETVFHVSVALDTVACGLYRLDYRGVVWYFIENDRVFGDLSTIGDDQRFAFFSKAVCVSLRNMDWRPDIIYCNDWQTALVPFYLRDFQLRRGLELPIRTVFTIHNVEFQGDFSYQTLTDVFGLSGILFAQGTMELEGHVNLMKGAIETADRVTTVSPSYARELTAPDASGPLSQVIADHQVIGILNGAPEDVTPEKSPYVHRRYDAASLDQRVLNKLWIQEMCGLRVQIDAPLFGFVGRFLPRKGIGLLAEVLPEFLDRGVQILFAGQGEGEMAALVADLRQRYPLQAAMLGYSDKKAAELYAGVDFLLMPSLEEPCGTTQMQAMRFGAVPVVRETGGLRDTVVPFNSQHPEGWGFTFSVYDKQHLRDAVSSALAAFRVPETWETLQKRCMARDSSWNGPAKEYLAVYEDLLKH